MEEREIGVEVKSSLNLPSKREMRSDVDKLESHKESCRMSIEKLMMQIERQEIDKSRLDNLSKNPVEDGIEYDKEACSLSSKRCDKHIKMFNALIKKEREKIDQLDYMIEEIEKRICLSDQISQ